jgi:hypothetical protein
VIAAASPAAHRPGPAHPHAHAHPSTTYTAVLKIFIRAVLSYYRRRAREHGVLGGRSGSVTFVQRFGSAANLNLHAHTIVLDGVFADHPAPAQEFDPVSRRAGCERRMA